MLEIPILLLGYNRPDRLRNLIRSLAPHSPKLLLIAIDGPKQDTPSDLSLVKECQNVISDINWDAQVHTRFRKSNLGLQHAVSDAVSWAMSSFGSAIVIEDDVTIGQDFIPYMCHSLRYFRDNLEIAHINGYNVVPREQIATSASSRISRYPESYAWATWDRSWLHYDPEMTWARSVKLSELAYLLGNYRSALKWKLNFADAASERVDTWAYRWVGSIWANNMKVVSPNVNLASYHGWSGGTHTFRKPAFKEIPITDSDIRWWLNELQIDFDKDADSWVGSRVFRESYRGLAEAAIASLILSFR
jgi:hypothetical protein